MMAIERFRRSIAICVFAAREESGISRTFKTFELKVRRHAAGARLARANIFTCSLIAKFSKFLEIDDSFSVKFLCLCWGLGKNTREWFFLPS